MIFDFLFGFFEIFVKSSFDLLKISIIKMDGGMHVLRHLIEQLAWATNKQLLFISNVMLPTKELKIKLV